MAAPVTASLGAAPIVGGPEYDSIGGSGYGSPRVLSAPGDWAGTTVGVAWATKLVSGVNMGERAIRWDAKGASQELGHLGTDESGFTVVRGQFQNVVGTAVGSATRYQSGLSKGQRAVRWNASGTAAEELGHFGTNQNGSTTSGAYAINAYGVAVGYAAKYASSGDGRGYRAVRWEALGTSATELGHLGTSPGGSTFSYAEAINDSGTAVGYAEKFVGGVSQGNRAVRWSQSGTAATELGGVAGLTSSYAVRISASGTAVGHANTVSGGNVSIRALRWSALGTEATELGNLGTQSNGVSYSWAHDINAADTAIGYSYRYESGKSKGARAVRWDATGTRATELGHLGTAGDGSTTSNACSINSAGFVAGWANEYDPAGSLVGTQAVVWALDGAAIRLDSLVKPEDGWTRLSEASAINDRCWITGVGQFDPDGSGPAAAYDRLFLLDAFPLLGTRGDATRDGVVNFDDLLILAQHYGKTAEVTWDNGDFNLDTFVNFDDLLILAQNYQSAALSTFDQDYLFAQSLVPEPMSLAALLAALALPIRQRK